MMSVYTYILYIIIVYIMWYIFGVLPDAWRVGYDMIFHTAYLS